MPIITGCDPFGQHVPHVDRPRAPRFSQGSPSPQMTYDPAITARHNLPTGDYHNGVHIPPAGEPEMPSPPVASPVVAMPKPDAHNVLVDALQAAMRLAEAHHSSCSLPHCAICAAVDSAVDAAFQAIKVAHYYYSGGNYA